MPLKGLGKEFVEWAEKEKNIPVNLNIKKDVLDSYEKLAPSDSVKKMLDFVGADSRRSLITLLDEYGVKFKNPDKTK